MDKNAIKKYAVWARRELIEKVSQKAMQFGIEDKKELDPDLESINGILLSEEEKKQRQALVRRITLDGYSQVIEEVAYTWFNRFIALRFMEVNGYLPSHVRVFTDDDNNFKPQILSEALHIDLNGLNKEKVYEMKSLNQDEELFRYLIIVQCNDLNSILPRMFQKISDYTELLLPDFLLREGSVVEQLVSMIPESDWTDQVQIIGWLYQYYNSEKKDDVFEALKKNIKISKENIPAATQLFTPEWIVRYMVENSLGRYWLDGHPEGSIRREWNYYLDEEKQEHQSVIDQLEGVKKAHAGINPEDIKCLDPSCGSGHILAYIFDVLIQIYQEHGYTTRDAAKSIILNNLYGLDIDERAAQLAYFLVMMKGRQYDRRFFNSEIQPHVYAVVESNEIDGAALQYFCADDSSITEIVEVVDRELRNAKEYGSMIAVTNQDWSIIHSRIDEIKNDISIFRDIVLQNIVPIFQVTETLAQKYDVIVTNPPYLSNGGMDAATSDYCKKYYFDSKGDLCTVFIEKTAKMLKKNGYCGLITMQSWMFLTSFEKLRRKILDKQIINMLHLGPRAFAEIGGEVVNTTAFVFSNNHLPEYKAKYIRLVDYKGQDEKEEAFLNTEHPYVASPSKFLKIPNAQVAYWISDKLIDLFEEENVGKYAISDGQTKTGNNDRYLRKLWEINTLEVGKGNKWVPHAKGGTFRRWYGNVDTVIDWSEEARNHYKSDKVARIAPEYIWFREGVCWNLIKSGEKFAARLLESTSTFNIAGPSIFFDDLKMNKYVIGLLNSIIAEKIINFLNPTLSTNIGDIYALPLLYKKDPNKDELLELIDTNIKLAQKEWNDYECSLGFTTHPMIRNKEKSIKDSFENWRRTANERINESLENEKRMDHLFIQSYGLDQVFEERNYSSTLREVNALDAIKSFISYSVGCMFGRFSLDKEGLIFTGGKFDKSGYGCFNVDIDNIIPICDDEYFDDDIVARFVDFVKIVFGDTCLEDNLQFIADTLGGKGTSREIIRGYFINDFYSDHVKMYQKKPIYWLFDSGKKNGFKCLIYMHRYNSDTIARIRTDYVHEQQSRYRTAIEETELRCQSAQGTDKVKLEKKLKNLREQDNELHVYEEKIHHLADQMIEIDLDDGVKINYSKFKDVLSKI